MTQQSLAPLGSAQVPSWLVAAGEDPALMVEFAQLCSFGGRLAGTPQEAQAMAWAVERLSAIAPGVQLLQVPYDGWRCLGSALHLLDAQGQPAQALRCRPLLRSASTEEEGLEAEVIDLGEGRTEDFEAAGEAVRGKVALVRHEYPFSPRHLHRRRKYDMAVKAGAAGFLIANPLPGAGVLSGSSGRPVGGFGIPAAYIDNASGEALAAAARQGEARVLLQISGEEIEGARAGVAVLDIPGGTGQTIVLSAHLDGHDTGCSALDNATGLSVVLAAARALAPHVSKSTHGLRVCFFSAEEWALAGSARYLADMPQAERDALALDINLDTVGGDSHLTALISGFAHLAPWMDECAQLSGVPAGTYLPLMPNSDHANFAAHGIPALRLVAGFDRPDSGVRHILSEDDQPGVIQESELRQALRLTCAMGWTALHAPRQTLAQWRER
jgi:aminopeptidase YwaD